MRTADDFARIRTWDGSRHKAWEQLCFQLRPPPPPNTATTKTGDPDAGLEWYVTFPDGHQDGWQAKYSDDPDLLIGLMRQSLVSVVTKRAEVTRLTFCVPIDLPAGRDRPGGRRRTRSARQRFDDAVGRWRRDIPGADRVEIVFEGAGEIAARLALPEHRGREWFWWNERVLDLEWFRARLDEAIETAGARYSPDLNVDLPIRYELDALGAAGSFWLRYEARRDEVRRRIADVARFGRQERPHWNELLGSIERFASTIVTAARALPADETGRQAWVASARDVVSHAWAFAYEPPAGQRAETDASGVYARRLGEAADDFASYLDTAEFRAAVTRAYLLLGEAGHGKTHLFLTHARASLDAGRPELVFLGQRFGGLHPWISMREQLGLAHLDVDVFVGALEAAAEAYGCRLTVLIDALNEADDMQVWRNELATIRARLLSVPHLALGLSLRTAYERHIRPEGGWTDRLAVSHHPGFAGAEARAARAFFAAYEIEDPRVPLLGSTFANPLFLKLWCQGLKDAGLTAPPAGSDRLSAVFARYVSGRARHIADRMGLDHRDRLVEQAVEALAQAMAERSTTDLPREEAKAIVGRYAPHLQRWPETLYGRLVSDGLLVEHVTWVDAATEERTAFAYQLFSDHLITSALLELHAGDVPRDGSLPPGAALAARLHEAPAGVIHAAAIQLPERYGRELVDLVRTSSAQRARTLTSAFLGSLVLRRLDALGERAIALFDRLDARPLNQATLGVYLAMAAEPDHPLNAERLQRRLAALSLPVRDVEWTIPMYYTLDDESPAASRLIRWASEGPYPSYDPLVVRLASIPICWLLSSSNRVLRDTATKALSNLWQGRFDVAARLNDDFADVNDPYISERVMLAAYGALMRSGDGFLEQAEALARSVLRRYFSSPTVMPRAQTRDAATGIVRWARSRDLIEAEEAAAAEGPFRSDAPATPSAQRQVNRLKERGEYGSLYFSIFPYGDFGHYVLEPRVRRFSRARLSTRARSRTHFHAADDERARRWVWDRVLEMGWTPERFAGFDRTVGAPDRRPPRHERIGKKYQWIAIDELIARMVDNYRPLASRYRDEDLSLPDFIRDLDPSLPPPNPDSPESPPFESDPITAWWVRPLPTFGPQTSGAAWIEGTGEIPDLPDALLYEDPGGRHWVALRAHASWTEPSEREELEGRRHQWWQIETWMVPRGQGRPLADVLRAGTRGDPWLPEGPKFIDDAYLGEIGRYEPGCSDGAYEVYANGRRSDLRPLPGAGRYAWESEARDGSLRESAILDTPNPILISWLGLRWDGMGGRWLSGDRVVAEYRAVDGRLLDSASVLLFDEEALRRYLSERDQVLAVRLRGEREIFQTNHVYQPWMEVDAVGLLDGEWRFDERQETRRYPAR